MSVSRRQILGGAVAGAIATTASTALRSSESESSNKLVDLGKSSQPSYSTTSLKDLAQQAGIHFGCAVEKQLFQDQAFQDLVKRECNMLVCENHMKMKALCPSSPDNYDFSQAEPYVQFAEANNMVMRGHPLVLAWFSFLIGLKENYRGQTSGAPLRIIFELLLVILRAESILGMW